MALDRVLGNAQLTGDLSLRQAMDLSQHHHLPASGRQLIQRRLQTPQLLPARHDAIGRNVLGHDVQRLKISDGLDGHDARPPRPVAEQVAGRHEHERLDQQGLGLARRVIDAGVDLLPCVGDIFTRRHVTPQKPLERRLQRKHLRDEPDIQRGLLHGRGASEMNQP